MTYALIIHGGAGDGSLSIFKNIEKKFNYSNLENKYHDSLKECLLIGDKILKNNGSAIDAVTECIKYLENNELFNAGKGAVSNCEGNIFHDSCIVDGKTKDFGATCLTNNVKNPIELSKNLMLDESIMIAGNDASEKYCNKFNLPLTNSTYFKSEYRNSLAKFNNDLGTVGVVALDKNNNICAGTSTGGRQNKKVGRIGDTPLIGVSTIADNNFLGISCTGNGEEIIKQNTASQILYRCKFKNETLKQSIDNTLNEINGSCGIIGINKEGDVYFKSNTERMYTGYISSKEELKTFLWDNEK